MSPASAGLFYGGKKMIDRIKRQIAVKIRDYATQVSLTQRDIAELTSTTQPRVSRLFNLNLDTFSLDSMFKMLQNLDIETTLTFK
jgi:predicted XRE-type DNA-binding protein